jgi:SAM-dependent methyltransferase
MTIWIPEDLMPTITLESMRASMHARLHQREERIHELFKKAHRLVDEGKMGGEEGRIWLEKYCVGKGVQVCCGDFSLGDSIGVDLDARKVAMDLWIGADLYYLESEPLDYIVTNYLECLPEPLRVLEEWARHVKPGGVLAIVCRDAEAYEDEAGPLVNHRRVSCFTITTLRCYLARAGFEVFAWENLQKELRVAARKR